MSEITPQTTVHDLLKAHPELLDFLVAYHPEFRLLKNPALRSTMGRVATLERVASKAGVSVEQLIRHIHARLQSPPDAASQAARLDQLKGIIRRLHGGEGADQLRAEFAGLLQGADPTDIARMEQDLIREGMPVEEIHRLCDLHVNVFESGLESQESVPAPPGHPIHTYQAENAEISRRAQRWADLCRTASADTLKASAPEFQSALEALARVEIHYVRKENQLFPYLEKKSFSAPSQVMWAVHDDIRRMIKEARAALERGDVEAVRAGAPELARVIVEMIYKEEKILFPNAWKLLSADDWRAIRAGDDDIGYLVPPAGAGTSEPAAAQPAPAAPGGLIALNTGALTLEQLDRMLVHMPVEFSFVDDQDVVRYYSGQPERVFPRSPGVIGRTVQNCHPPRSLATVNAILKAFRDGARDHAEFWIPYKGKFLYITYHAVRDASGRYLGTLEMTLDATRIRQLQGEQRLLDWEKQQGTQK